MRVDGLVDRPMYRKKGKDICRNLNKSLCKCNCLDVLLVRRNIIFVEIPTPIKAYSFRFNFKYDTVRNDVIHFVIVPYEC